MSYQILARRSRPQSFADVVGQEAVVQALSNALSEERIAHAYLFSGIRGVGKTSVARILAKALNCTGEGAPPCNDCDSCREITLGASLDVIEVDAATYSKVDQIRDLTDGLQYGPSGGGYKVVIIDEIHRLSRQAFDALLKIVEEPPAHLVFVFATTDVDAVPATILSRCQEFSFRRVPADLLAAHLGKLAEGEGLAVESGSLRRIARAAEGSVRDAVALLDQLSTLGDGAIDDSEVARLLGGLDLSALAQLFASVAAGNRSAISAQIAEVRGAGRDPRRIYTELLGFAREVLHIAAGVPEEAIDLPVDEARELGQLVDKWGYENVLRMVQHLLESEPLLRQVDTPFLALELALLRAAELPRLVAVEKLLEGELPEASVGGGGGNPLPGQTASDHVDEAGETVGSAGDAANDDPDEELMEAEPADRASAVPTNGDSIGSLFVEAVRVSKPSLAAHLARAEVSVDGSRLRVEHSPDDQLLARAWNRGNNQEVVVKAARELLGDAAEVDLVANARLQNQDIEEGGGGGVGTDADALAASDDPQVQAVLDIFNGEVTSVTPATDNQQDKP